MKNHSDLPTQVCHLTQMAARAAIDDLTSVPDLNDLRPYHELCEALSLAASADYTAKVVTRLGELANL